MARRTVVQNLLLWMAIPPLFIAAAAGQDAAVQGPGTAQGLDTAAWLDSEFAQLWAAAGDEPQPVDDETFLRRVSLDLVGTIPSVAQARDYLNDAAPDKRNRLVDRLLADRRSPEHLARMWRRMIAPPGPAGSMAQSQLEPWLTQRFTENTSFDDLTRRLLTGTYEGDAPAAAAFGAAAGAGAPEMADAASRIFLGVRIGCARCHDHPFTDWKQQDFWGTAAFFAPDGATVIVGDDGQTYPAKLLGTNEPATIPAGRNPREVFAQWLTSESNPYFAAAAVNRTWQQLVGRGLIVPVEELDLAKAEERAVLLDRLAARFAASDFDFRALVAGICKSRAYAAASPPPAGRVPAPGMRPLKVMAPEQVFDALEQALMLPVTNNDGSPRHNGQRDSLVARFDESAAASPEDFQAGIPQALLMMNGRLTADAVNLEDSRTLRAVVEAPFLSSDDKVETLYLATLTRKPRPDEAKVMRDYLEARPTGPQREEALAEIFWTLLNSPEFVISR